MDKDHNPATCWWKQNSNTSKLQKVLVMWFEQNVSKQQVIMDRLKVQVVPHSGRRMYFIIITMALINIITTTTTITTIIIAIYTTCSSNKQLV